MAKATWQDVKDKLSVWPGSSNPGFLVKVDEARKRVREAELDKEGLGGLMRQLRTEKERMEAFVEQTNAEIEAVNQELGQIFRQEGLQSFTLSETGDQLYMSAAPHVSVKDREANRLWAIESGHQQLLQVPWQTLNAMQKDRIKEAMESGESVEEAVLPGCEVFMEYKIKLRKA